MSWVIIFCSFLGVFCLLVGGLAGMAWEQHCAERDCEAEAEAEADEQIEREPRPDFDAIRAAGRRAWAIQQQRAETAMAWSSPLFGAWPVPELSDQQPVVLADSDRELLAGINARLDRWLDENVYGAQQ